MGRAIRRGTLKTIEDHTYYTRELLKKQKEYGHLLLKRAYELKLVERKRVKPVPFANVKQ